MTTTMPVRAAHFPPRTAFRELMRTEWLLVLRQRNGLIVGIGLPVVLMLIFGIIPDFRKPESVLGVGFPQRTCP